MSNPYWYAYRPTSPRVGSENSPAFPGSKPPRLEPGLFADLEGRLAMRSNTTGSRAESEEELRRDQETRS